MDIIRLLCNEHNLDFDWVKEELLKEFHERKIRNQEVDDQALVKIIEKALNKLQ
jgi:hypothetical protein